jgi:antitoxin ParD1/3/4
MNTIERLTITLTAEIAEAVHTAVAAGEYASSSEVIREALRDWRHKRALQRRELEDLRTQIQRGVDDLDAGRVRDFNPERIIQTGRQRLTPPAVSASPTRPRKT